MKFTKMFLKRIFALSLAIISMLAFASCDGNSDESKESDQSLQDESEAVLPKVDPIADNFRTFYQVFVGSYSDSNGDGFGDIRGIINRMDYLNDGDINSGKSLGVQGIWLSPIFSSPSYHKYDATDYYKIDWRFGEEKDLKELADLCEERNVKLILDLAINHTSKSHKWFNEFKTARTNGDVSNKYYDYYTCVTTAEKQNGIAYQKIAGIDCWYECNFSGDMPELNFDNEDVKKEVLDIAKHYLDLGIDGFRFDAVKYIYYGNTKKSADFWNWYVSELKKIKSDIYCVGECWSGESEIIQYYKGLNCFNFAMAQAEGTVASAAKGFSITKYTNYIESFQKRILEESEDAMIMGFLSNHDMDRIAGAFVTENNMRMAANLYLLCSGSPVIYYGEEIGMKGSRGTENTDANRRLAMLWGDGDKVKNPVGSTYSADKQIKTTVATQLEDENSLCNYYRKLIAIRHKYEAIARGAYTSLDCGSKNYGGFLVEYKEEKIGIFHNTSTEEISYDLKDCKDLAGVSFEQLGDYIGCGTAKLEGSVLTIGPQTSVIVK